MTMWTLLRTVLPHFLLKFLGLAQKKGKFLLIGLDNAGKTTLLELLKTGKFSANAPTLHGTKEVLSINNGDLELTGFDLGGHREVRRVWRDYYGAMDAVVFMVDASDIFRLEEARSELQSVLTDDGLRRRSVPILIMANKIDAEGALERSQMIYNLGLYPYLSDTPKLDHLGIHDHRGMVDNEDKPVKEGGSIAATTAGRHCRRSTTSPTSRSPVQLFCISLKFRQGYGTAFSWLAQFLE